MAVLELKNAKPKIKRKTAHGKYADWVHKGRNGTEETWGPARPQRRGGVGGQVSVEVPQPTGNKHSYPGARRPQAS